MAYEGKANPLHYTMKFIDGLRPEFRSAILLQRPSDLDIVFVLAQLQEEVLDPVKRKEFHRSDFGSASKPFSKQALPLPAPPGKHAKPANVVSDNSRVGSSPSTEDRWRALRSFRRAKGLCQFCAEKWSKDHKCSDTVQLHVLQELCNLLQSEDDNLDESGDVTVVGDQLFLTLSVAAVYGVPFQKPYVLWALFRARISAFWWIQEVHTPL